MKIKRIVIDGFKNLNKTEVLLNNMNGILSVNNYGKSNLLKAIEFGFDFITSNIKDKNNMMKWQPGISILKNKYAKDYNFEIEFEESINDVIYSVIYNYKLKWYVSTKDEGKVISEFLKMKKNDDTQKYSLIMERNEDTGLFKSSQSGRCDRPITIENDNLLVNKLCAYDNLYYIDLLNTINKLEFYIDKHFDSNDLYGVNPIIRKNVNDLSPIIAEAGGIARALNKLQKINLNKYNLIKNTFLDFFPDIEDISVKEIDFTQNGRPGKIPEDVPFEFADYVYIILAKTKHIDKYINFEMMSDGAKRLLSVLTSVTLADINNIPLIAIEEPENSVHPGLLRKYIDVLEQFPTNSKLILTSHSPNLINYMNLEDLYLGIPTNDGSASFGKLKSTYINKINECAEDMSMMTGEYLFDLMSSYDESDKETLLKYLNYEQKN